MFMQQIVIVDTIIVFANNTVGSSNYYINGQGYCQAFVKDCYEAAGIYASSNPGTATEAKNRWRVSTDLSNIPIGACIYYNLNHVSLYVGNNQIIHLRSGKYARMIEVLIYILIQMVMGHINQN